jgi:hypothetical protein
MKMLETNTTAYFAGVLSFFSAKIRLKTYFIGGRQKSWMVSADDPGDNDSIFFHKPLTRRKLS